MGPVGVHGVLTYLELPASQHVVDERESLALRSKTQHFVRDARQMQQPEPEPESSEPETELETQPRGTHSTRARDILTLKTSGFQLFCEVPYPPDTGNAAEMAAHKRLIEDFVRTKLLVPGHFHLGGHERVSHVIAYNHAVRCSDNRQCRGSKPIISDVHSDFTRTSGPNVLAHVLSGGHLRPAQRKSRKVLLKETLRGRYRYCFLNVWRSLDTKHPIQEWPLALLHPRSCNPSSRRLEQMQCPVDHAVKTKKHAIFPENCPTSCSQ